MRSLMRGLRLFLLASLVGVTGLLLLRLARPNEAQEARTTLAVAEVLGGGEGGGFNRVLTPRPFQFPQDHGPHPEYRTEWWYVTGNLEGPGGEAYGFQFTIFRSGLSPDDPAGQSPWATNQVYMGHFALTDVRNGTFRAYERFARGAQGLAGGRAAPFRVWLEDWVLEGPPSGEGLFPLKLTAGEGDRGVSLVLRPSKPMVLQGDRGLSQKGPEPGNASFYYSFTRLAAEGNITVEGEELPVQGEAWLDREWSSSALSPDQVGWDWFALQLSDGRDLMYYQLRLRDGTADPLSKGVLVERDGRTQPLTSEMIELTVLERWESPMGGDSYPSRWRIAIPDEDIDLDVIPLLSDQELDLTFRYWEGAVGVEGLAGGTPVEGRGYVELTGYSDTVNSGRAATMGRGTSRP